MGHEYGIMSSEEIGIGKTEDINEVVGINNTIDQQTSNELTGLEQMMKSPESIKFVELTDKQNALVDESQGMANKISPMFDELAKINLEDTEKVTSLMIPLCREYRIYIDTFSNLVKIIDEKSDLIDKHPIISDELFNGQQNEIKDLLSQHWESQAKILTEEMQYYKEIDRKRVV